MNDFPATAVEDLIAVDQVIQMRDPAGWRLCDKETANAVYRGLHRTTHHDLRHLFAARCVEGGVDVFTAADMLGGQRTVSLTWRILWLKLKLILRNSKGIT
jgi:site-specific recombinase XerD